MFLIYCINVVKKRGSMIIKFELFKTSITYINHSMEIVNNLGPVHMGLSYLGCRENISTGQIILFCSYG